MVYTYIYTYNYTPYFWPKPKPRVSTAKLIPPLLRPVRPVSDVTMSGKYVYLPEDAQETWPHGLGEEEYEDQIYLDSPNT